MFRWFVRRRKLRLTLSRYLGPGAREAIPSSHCPKKVPKLLWTYWKQGERAAPELVQYCLASWRRLNPGWDFRVLDEGSVSRFTAMTGLPPRISVQSYADVLRLRLLDEHGGVWVDATTLCATPLDEWLPPLMQSGFFGFARPGPDREIASWFLASQPGGAIIRGWRRASDAYWRTVGRAYHYYWLHYLFEWLTLKDRRARTLWADTPHISADGPHLIQRCLRHGRDPARLDAATSLDAIPVHKLTWRESIAISEVERILQGGHAIASR